MNYKNYIPTADRKLLYAHATKHAQLTSEELHSDVWKMINHIEFMQESSEHCNKIIQEWSKGYQEKIDHPFKNLWNWACNLIDRVIAY